MQNDDQGNVYYYNFSTSETSWDPPDNAPKSALTSFHDSAEIQAQWHRPSSGCLVYFDHENDLSYYEDCETGETFWEPPRSDIQLWDVCDSGDGESWYYVPRQAFNSSGLDADGNASWTSFYAVEGSTISPAHNVLKEAKVHAAMYRCNTVSVHSVANNLCLLLCEQLTHKVHQDSDGSLWLQSAYSVRSQAVGHELAQSVQSTNPIQEAAQGIIRRASNTPSAPLPRTQWEYPETGWLLQFDESTERYYYLNVETGVRFSTTRCAPRAVPSLDIAVPVGLHN